MTKLSGMFDLIRILDLRGLRQITADQKQGAISGRAPQKPAQIHADAKRVAVKLQRNAAAKVEFKVKVATGL